MIKLKNKYWGNQYYTYATFYKCGCKVMYWQLNLRDIYSCSLGETRCMKKQMIFIVLMVCMLLAMLPMAGQANVGDTFTANITVGSDNAVSCTFKVLTEPADGRNGTVQIGNNNTAIDRLTAGELIIPEQVKQVKSGNELIYDVTAIGRSAFSYCKELTGNLTIPDSVTTIGDLAFYYCSGFNGNLTIPDSVTRIGERAFYFCRELSGNLTIPDTVTEIGYGAFYYCRGFTGNLIIPDLVTKIEKDTFAYCTGLTGTLTIPTSITEIGNTAFLSCSGFTGNLTIPAGVTTIGTQAFLGCGLESVNLLCTTAPSVSADSFSGTYLIFYPSN